MVVMHTQVSPSAVSNPPRKNRRRQSKKTPRTAVLVGGNGADDEISIDQESQPVVPSSAVPPVDDDDDLIIDTDTTSHAPPTSAPVFPPIQASALRGSLKSETRRIPIPPHRMTPLKKDWINIFGPLTEILGLQVRMNIQRKCVEARVRSPFLPFFWYSSSYSHFK